MMNASKTGFGRLRKLALGALAFGTLAAGFAAAPAMAHDWDNGWRGGWDHRVDHDRYDRARHQGWAERRGWDGRIYYDAPRVYYPAPPVVYAPPPAYYPGSLNVVIPLR